jgi:hypothetical protein
MHLLILSLVTGSLSAQAPNPVLSTIPPNTALDLGPYTCNQPADWPRHCLTVTDYSGFQYDPNNHQMLMFGGGHSASCSTDVVAFSFASLAWSSMYPSTLVADMVPTNVDGAACRFISTNHPLARHTYDLMAVTTNTKELLLFGAGWARANCGLSPEEMKVVTPHGVKISHYDPVAKTWAYGPPRGSWSGAGSAEYDPVSGKVILVTEKGLWFYDPVVKSAPVKALSYVRPIPLSQNLVYFPPSRRMYYIGSNTVNPVWEVTLDRTHFSRSMIEPMTGITGDIPPRMLEVGYAYDSANRIIGGGVKDGKFYAFDPVTKTWTSRTMQVDPHSDRKRIGSIEVTHALAYDAVDNVFIFITNNASGRHTWAYKYADPSSTRGIPR